MPLLCFRESGVKSQVVVSLDYNALYMKALSDVKEKEKKNIFAFASMQLDR